MEDFLQNWGYLGIFLGIVLTGVPFVPMPEELPVVLGGALAGSHDKITWWIMLPVCIVAVVLGDGLLYTIGRFWGPRLVEYRWVKKSLLPPERLQSIKNNFDKHGIKILLFARLTPGIRGPIFFTAGITHLPLSRFMLADAIYAVPGVTLLFFLGYWFSSSMVDMIKHEVEYVKNIIIVIVVVGVAGYFLYRFLRKPMVTGDPQEIPPLVEKVTHTIEGVTHTLEQVTTKIIHPMGGKSSSSAAEAPGKANPTGANPPVDGQVKDGKGHAPRALEEPGASAGKGCGGM